MRREMSQAGNVAVTAEAQDSHIITNLILWILNILNKNIQTVWQYEWQKYKLYFYQLLLSSFHTYIFISICIHPFFYSTILFPFFPLFSHGCQTTVVLIFCVCSFPAQQDGPRCVHGRDWVHPGSFHRGQRRHVHLPDHRRWRKGPELPGSNWRW